MNNPLEIYLSTSFVGDLSYQAPASQVAGMAHTFVTGRKTWKTSKGKNEAVWPAHIEAALFDALEKYRPTSSSDPRLLHRFPKRNRFISDHIMKVTGKVRTPKQVGSRLQQLRDTCPEERVLKLLSRREFPPEPKTQELSPARSESPLSPTAVPSLFSSSTSTSPTSSPVTSEFPDLFHCGLSLSSPGAISFPDRQVARPCHSTVLVDVVSRSASESSLGIEPSHILQPVYLATFTFSTNGLYPTLRPEQCNVQLVRTGSLSGIPPSVKILCTTPLPNAARSIFCVFFNDELVKHEITDHELLPDRDVNYNVQYAIKLIPEYWATLSKAPDLSRYTITHDVVKVASIDAGQTVQENILCTIVYRFNCVDFPKYLPPLELHVPGVPHLGPGVTIYAPRPLLLDTANTLLSAPLAQSSHTWYDNCGMATPETSEDASYDFLSVGETELSRYCRLEQLSDEPMSYLNFGPTW